MKRPSRFFSGGWLLLGLLGLFPAIGWTKSAQAPADGIEVLDAAAPAQQVHRNRYGDEYPSMDRGLDHLNAHMLRRRNFSTLISHRNREGILQSPFSDLLGFDGGGLKIILGLRYAFLDDLDVGFVRQNGVLEIFDTWEFDVRYRLLRQSGGRPFDLAVRLGVDWFNAPNQNAAGVLAQLLLTRRIADRALVTAGLLFASNSSGPTKGLKDAPASSAAMLQLDLRLSDSLAFDIEYTQNIAGFHERYPIIAMGPKIISNRHTFSFVVANSQYMTADSLIANTYYIGAKTWVLGFHITREIDI
jgi:hypothetical protein